MIFFARFLEAFFCQRNNVGKTITGWWFGTFFIFHNIWDNHPNWLIFFRGVKTTNQIIYKQIPWLGIGKFIPSIKMVMTWGCFIVLPTLYQVGSGSLSLSGKTYLSGGMKLVLWETAWPIKSYKIYKSREHQFQPFDSSHHAQIYTFWGQINGGTTGCMAWPRTTFALWPSSRCWDQWGMLPAGSLLYLFDNFQYLYIFLHMITYDLKWRPTKQSLGLLLDLFLLGTHLSPHRWVCSICVWVSKTHSIDVGKTIS